MRPEMRCIRPDRLLAFYDGVMAIIMTILVLDLKVPKTVSLEGFLAQSGNFFSYTMSFLWLGIMWLNHYTAWSRIQKTGIVSAALTLVLLFVTSFFPYAESLVGEDPDSQFANVVFGILVIVISLLNMLLSHVADRENHTRLFGLAYFIPDWLMKVNLAVFGAGMFLTLFVVPWGMMASVFVTVSTLVLYFIFCIPYLFRGEHAECD